MLMTKQIQDAYIVAATRTPVGKAPRGVFRNTRPDDMLAHVLRSVTAQAPGIDVGRIEDAVIGCAMPEGEQGMNVARIGVLLAGLPDTVAAQTINRFCSSGLQAVALAADQVRLGNADLVLAGGTESMSMVPMMGNKVALSPNVFRPMKAATTTWRSPTAWASPPRRSRRNGRCRATTRMRSRSPRTRRRWPRSQPGSSAARSARWRWLPASPTWLATRSG